VLPIDADVYAELKATGTFDSMGLDADEVRGEGFVCHAAGDC
jgi:hypothetical protein